MYWLDSCFFITFTSFTLDVTIFFSIWLLPKNGYLLLIGTNRKTYKNKTFFYMYKKQRFFSRICLATAESKLLIQRTLQSTSSQKSRTAGELMSEWVTKNLKWVIYLVIDLSDSISCSIGIVDCVMQSVTELVSDIVDKWVNWLVN